MANNRMYLVNENTGEKIFIAKYYSNTGWYIASPKTLAKKIDKAFHKVDFGETSIEEALKNNIQSNGGQ